MPEFLSHSELHGELAAIAVPFLPREQTKAIAKVRGHIEVLSADRDRLATELAECRTALANESRGHLVDLKELAAAERERDSARDDLREAREALTAARTILASSEVAHDRIACALEVLDAALVGPGEARCGRCDATTDEQVSACVPCDVGPMSGVTPEAVHAAGLSSPAHGPLEGGEGEPGEGQDIVDKANVAASALYRAVGAVQDQRGGRRLNTHAIGDVLGMLDRAGWRLLKFHEYELTPEAFAAKDDDEPAPPQVREERCPNMAGCGGAPGRCDCAAGVGPEPVREERGEGVDLALRLFVVSRPHADQAAWEREPEGARAFWRALADEASRVLASEGGR